MEKQDATYAPECDYEKLSYGKFVYKRVQRLRRKGKNRGIEVPYLNYELNKPEKPRIAFWVIAAVSAVLFVGILVGIGFLINAIIKFYAEMNNTGVGDMLKNLFNPDYIAVSLGITAGLGIVLAVLAYGIALAILSVFISIAIYFYHFVRDAFYMAKCSKEEFAKGNIISSRIRRLGFLLVMATVILIVLLIYLPASARVIVGIIYAGLVIALGGLLALMMIEKSKNAKWFESLEEDKKQNYLMHDKALRRVKSRIKSDRQFWESLGR